MATQAPDALTWQGSLFGSAPIEGDPSFATLRRQPLDEGAWVDLAPSWLTGADRLFALLVDQVSWTEREMPMYGQTVAQPRLSAWWSGRSPRGASAEVKAAVEALGRMLDRRYGVRFDSVGCNLYRNGADSVAFHGDRHARRPEHVDAVVAIVSLGAARRFLLRRRVGGGRSVAFTPASGDLLVMGGSCQRTWQHSIPKVAAAGARISVTFRHRC